ncbi:MAG: glycosyltransferase family 4 protein [Clostridium sp.]|uniref:glycosyltransferase family 4 protein n=1 Tax=Clostridium sp. TaxID=1506 RepID=UPI002A751C45|nr:glycosyltransferase family 4 protein [Clostridium sp.]MDY2631882.1 glycosyltransferase family 4 protein [Clostridium sp.]
MNILLINHYAGSDKHGMEFRPFYMAREWVKNGHDVTIVAADYSHLRKYNPEIDKDFTEEIIEGVRYLWIKTPKYSGNGVGRIINILTFINKLKFKARHVSEKFKPDAIIASSTYPLDIYPAAKIARISSAKLFFEIHDLWPLTPIEIGGYSPKHPYIMYLQAAEDYAYKNCNGIISILPDADKHIRDRGFSTENYTFVPNGVIINNEEKNSVEEPNIEQITILNNLKDEGYFLVGYTGNHSPANALDTMLKAAEKMKNKKIKFILVGSGNVKDELIKYSKEHNIDNVVFLDPVKKDAIPFILSKLDVAYMSLRKESLFRFGVSPNKLFDYMMASKPILYSVEASNDPVSDANCGISVKAEDADEVVKALEKFMSLSEEERKVMGKNGKEFVIKNHKYDVLAERFLNALK